MADRQVSIRLGTTGKADVTQAFDDIAASGDASAKRLKTSYDRAGQDVAAAIQRQANAAAKLAAIAPQSATQMRINDANGTGFGQWEGSAKQSAAAFRELLAAEEALEARTRALVASLDPAYAAQQRFNSEIGEARALVSAGTITLDQYCDKLRQEQAALDAATAAQTRGSTSAGAHRAALQGLSFQAQDAFTQISMGTNPLSVLAIQGGQAAGQMANLEGKLGAVASFFVGPWGLAITGGLLLLGALTDKFLKSGDAADQKTKSVKTLSEALDDLSAATGRQIKSEQAVQIETLRSAAALRQKALDARTATIEQLKLARANLAAAQVTEANTGGTVPGMGIPGRGAGSRGVELSELQRQLAKNEADIARSEVAFRQAQVPIMQGRVAEAFDKTAAATGRYNRAVDALNQRYADGKVNQGAYTAELSRLTVARDKATDAARGSGRASSAAADADALAASATTDVQRAQARLAQVRAEGRAELRAGTITQAEYTAKVAAAQGAVYAARDATKSHTQATKDAAEAQRELASDLAEVIRQFDPVRAAADQYALSLDKIRKLRGAGKITDADAGLYTMRAMQDESERQAQQRNETIRKTFGITGDPLGDFVKEADQARDVRMAADAEVRDREAAGREEGIRSAASLYRDLMTGGVNSIWDRFKQRGFDVLADLLAKWTMGDKGGGGLLQSIGNLFGKPKNASGTERWGGGLTWVAENGPELINLPAGARISSAPDTRRMLAAGQPTAVTIQVQANDYFDARVANISGQGIQAAAPSIAYAGEQLGARRTARARRRSLVGA